MTTKLAAITLLAFVGAASLAPVALAQSAPQQSSAGSIMHYMQRNMQLSSQSLLTGPITSKDLEPPESVIEYSDVQGGVKLKKDAEPKEDIRQ